MKVYHFSEMTHNRGSWAMMLSDLIDAPVVHTGEWQAMKTAGSPAHATHELEDVSLVWDRIPSMAGGVANLVPDIDHAWAVEHFEERVSGQPLNPAPSHVRWPYAVRGNADHTRCPTCDSPEPRKHPATQSEGEVTHICPDPFHSGTSGKFDHTYPERLWPKHAGHNHGPFVQGWDDPVSGVKILEDNCGGQPGIRFHYGDLMDVVDLLVRSPLTRQAFVPIWFPEDTGATEGQRVPCTIGYHFMQRGGRLSCRYYIRSCDAYRHLSNDVFLAAALTNWVCNKVTEKSQMRFRPGSLVMHISSLHAFVADVSKLKARIDNMDGELVERSPV